MAKLLGEEAGDHPGEDRHRVGYAFYDAERGCWNTKHGKEAWQDDRRRLIAEIAQRACDTGPDHRPVSQPFAPRPRVGLSVI